MTKKSPINEERALLAALSDDLALPLLQIKNAAELLEATNKLKKTAGEHLQSVNLSAHLGLQLIEAYRLALRASSSEDLPLEPVSVGAVLQDIAHQLTPFAKEYNTILQVDITGKLTPVLAHQASLTTALEVLSTSLIRAQASLNKQKKYQIVLGAHRTADNVIAAGVFSSTKGLSDRTLRAAHHLAGKARQPLPAVPAGAASGILIADMLCTAMWQPLRAAAHHNLRGLATTVPISKQLQFV